MESAYQHHGNFPEGTVLVKELAGETAVNIRGPKGSAAYWLPGPEGNPMNAANKYDVLVLGSGTGGKLIARAVAQEGHEGQTTKG